MSPCLEIFFLGIELWISSILFQHVKDVTLLSSGLPVLS